MTASSKYTKELKRRHTILRLLSENYPTAQCALYHQNAFQLLVATILSAQCTDGMVNKVTPKLFAVAPTPQAMVSLPLPTLQTIIKPTGFFVNKAKMIHQMSQQLLERFDGQVPSSMEELLTLSGVGRKTASVVLGAAFGKAEGIVVDTHVSRLSQRLQFVASKTADRIEKELMNWVPRELWIPLSHQLIHHGRNVCTARKPNCKGCFLSNYCPSAHQSDTNQTQRSKLNKNDRTH
ncbi:MAG: endonuclease III [bacterium]|nr:endonuclease III [bacterium]